MIDFMSRFEKFRVDEISIDKAEEDICFNPKYFDQSSTVILIGLGHTEDENNEWEKRKLDSSPVSPHPIEFQDLLSSKYQNNRSLIWHYNPKTSKKELSSVIGSTRICVDKKLHSALQNGSSIQKHTSS